MIVVILCLVNARIFEGFIGKEIVKQISGVLYFKKEKENLNAVYLES